MGFCFIKINIDFKAIDCYSIKYIPLKLNGEIMSVESLVEEYRNKVENNINEINNTNENLIEINKELTLKNNELNKYSFFKRVFSFSLKSEIQAIEAKKESNDLKLKTLNSARKRLYEILYQNLLLSFVVMKNNEAYKSINTHIEETNTLYKELCVILSSGKYCIDKIEEAIDSVDSAETTEMMDLFSKNNGIKMLSTLNNSTAHSDVEEANEALQNFINDVEKFKNKDICELSNLKDDNIFTNLDFDVTLDFLFDFYSFFTLSSLSDAKDNLYNAVNKIKPVVESIEKALSGITEYIENAEKEKTKLLHSNKVDVDELLRKNGILVK